MVQDLFIIHRRKPRTFEPSASAVWATCLRSLAFVDAETFANHADEECYAKHEAYSFLLEIICGLHSPIVGETEVFGQFKNFAKVWLELEPKRASLIQRLFNDAKALRSQYLSKVGTQSYGGWLKRRMKADIPVHVLGGGNLAQEILPYLQKQSPVTLHVRSPNKVEIPAVKVSALTEQAFTQGVLIVAAPMTSQEITQWLQGRKPTTIYDLRDNSKTDSIKIKTEQHGLEQIFSELEQTRERLAPLLEQIKTDIRARSLKVSGQPLVRPQGWDDLCA